MPSASPGKVLRRFVLDFLVEEALRRDPTVDGASRQMLAASFSVEPIADLGNARKYRIVTADAGKNRRAYIFLFRRPCADRAFRTTELLYRRCVAVLRDGDLGVPAHRRIIVVRERLLRHRVREEFGLILSELTDHPLQATRIETGPLVADIPKSLLALGIVEVYPRSPSGTRHDLSARSRDAQSRDAGGGDSDVIPVEVWLQRAYTDAFGRPPMHIYLADPDVPVYVVRVLEIDSQHEDWVLEVTRHLRVREGSIRLEVRLLDSR